MNKEICPQNYTIQNKNEMQQIAQNQIDITSEIKKPCEGKEWKDIITKKESEVNDNIENFCITRKIYIKKKNQDEQFVTMQNFDNYMISNYGRVFNLKTEEFLKITSPSITERNYVKVHQNSIGNINKVGELVAIHFIKAKESGDEVIYKDNNVKNDYVGNLLFGDPFVNINKINKIGLDEEFIKIDEDNSYYLSNYGRIFSKHQMSLVKTYKEKHGNYFASINGSTISLPRLVAKYFLPPNTTGYSAILHKNKNKSDNYYKNLYWGSRSAFKKRDLTGKKFGRLLVIEEDKNKKNTREGDRMRHWKCKCDCDGKIISVRQSSLVCGQQEGCGCINKERIKKVSQKETKWLDDLNIKDRQFKIIVNDTMMEVDGYDKNTNTVYEFLGDYWHGNPAIYNPTFLNDRSKKMMGDLYKETFYRFQKLQNAGYNVKYIWERDWDAKLDASDFMPKKWIIKSKTLK